MREPTGPCSARVGFTHGWIAGIAALLAAGCQEAGPVVAWVDEAFPTVVHVNWSGGPEGVGVVRWVDPDGHPREVHGNEAVSDHHLSAVGLLPGTAPLLEVSLDRDGSEDEVGSVTLEIPIAPAAIPDAHVQGVLPDGGYVLTHVLTLDRKDAVVIWDTQGRPAWYHVTVEGQRVLNSLVAGDGTLWFTTNAADYLSTNGYVHHVSLDGTTHEVWPLDRAYSGAPLPGGGFGYLAKYDAPWKDGTLIWEAIWEMAPDGSTREVFDFADWFEPEIFCACCRMEVEATGQVIYDWTHANGLVLSEDASAWYLMVRHYDALLKIDRASGQLLWVMGGPYGEFSFAPPGSEFMHAHTSTVEDDRLLVMDNGNHRNPPISRAAVYTYDAEARTADLVRFIMEPNGDLISLLGDVKDLPDGGLLVSWTTKGRIDAYDDTNRLLWRLQTPLGASTGRATWLPSLDAP
ncbi:MAG: aryl-sulfate sulfotransferase [Deltaproteobacteria bacterium]|nr:aryl-sulfate sulfotransferase [Deltaproteobacteria bacterium]